MDNQLVCQLTLMGSSIKEHFYYIVYKKKNPPRKKRGMLLADLMWMRMNYASLVGGISGVNSIKSNLSQNPNILHYSIGSIVVHIVKLSQYISDVSQYPIVTVSYHHCSCKSVPRTARACASWWTPSTSTTGTTPAASAGTSSETSSAPPARTPQKVRITDWRNPQVRRFSVS